MPPYCIYASQTDIIGSIPVLKTIKSMYLKQLTKAICSRFGRTASLHLGTQYDNYNEYFVCNTWHFFSLFFSFTMCACVCLGAWVLGCVYFLCTENWHVVCFFLDFQLVIDLIWSLVHFVWSNETKKKRNKPKPWAKQTKTLK